MKGMIDHVTVTVGFDQEILTASDWEYIMDLVIAKDPRLIVRDLGPDTYGAWSIRYALLEAS